MNSIVRAAAVVLAGLCAVSGSPAQGGGWKRSRMAQGYYAAFVANNAGAQFRADCGPSSDGGRTKIQSVTYVPKGQLRPAGGVRGTITVDGATKQHTFQAQQQGGDPVEIKLGADDLDSLESLKDLIAAMRKGRSLSIEVPTLRVRDSFVLSDAARALGECW